jgi:ribulose-phosphate 3-epimerase
MIENADRYIPQFIKAGSDTVIIHVESSRAPHTDLQTIKQLGARAGVVLNPPTEFAVVEPFLPEVDHLLIMTVNPGFGAQQMIIAALEKVRQAQTWQERYGFPIEIDGGVNRDTLNLAKAAGADLFVAGNAVFGQQRPGQAFKTLTNLLR